MGSTKNNGRNQGPDGRGDKSRRRRGLPSVESLEGRLLLATGVSAWHPLNSNLADVKNGPMANEGQDLINVYQFSLAHPGDMAALTRQFPLIMFKGNSVGVDVKGTGNFTTFLTSVKNLGMEVNSSSAYYALAEGFIPIAQLPTLAQLPQTISAAPIYKPITRVGPTPPPLVPYQGSSFNEALQSEKIDTVRAQTGLDGTGVTFGVISDSVSLVGGGLADSIKTGDLPTGVAVLQEGPAGSSDEGRAMLENIHDLVPGSKLAFASGFFGPLAFGNSIRGLAQAGASVIADDLGYLNEPFFQDGLIQQGVNDVVTKNNAVYLSAAGNASIDNGYLSTFRGAQATLGGITNGRFMNFAPSGAAVTQLPITVSEPTRIMFQFDQPFYTEEPATSTNKVTSDLDFLVLDASGNVVFSGTSNNLATQQPTETVAITKAGTYTVAIVVKSGADPGHVEFTRFGGNSDNTLQVSQQFGSAGGTYYPSSFGHNAQANTIGVGAVPWWAATPFLGQNPLKSEPFSSPGPSITVFNPDGSSIGAPVTTFNPSVSGVDGGNTSFFEGPPIDTSNPPFPGQPATPTNLSQNLPSFFGTSAAVENVGAIAALLKQRNPNLTNEQVRAGLEANGTGLNGTPTNAYDSQGGFGLVNAVSALAAVDVLRVTSTNPPNGATLTQTPTQLIVTFNRPVDITTLSGADLAFISVPSSLTNMTVGNPVGVDDPRFPTQVAFPFVFKVAPGQLGNGTFTYVIQSPANGKVITSKDGKPLLTSYFGSFAIADTVTPRVVNATINGRIITVQFSEPANPASITPATLFLARTDSTAHILSILNNDPRFKLSYNPNTATATLDYSGLDQTQLPTGYYKLVVRAGNLMGNGTSEVGVTDIVGNKLDGEFFGQFPSGDGDPKTPANPSGRNSDENFVEFIGLQTLTAPVITTLRLVNGADSGIKGDENTNSLQPVFVGQVAAGFPGTLSGLTVLAEFSGLHGGALNLAPQNGFGYQGVFDVQTTTDASGTFRLNAPFLPEGFERVRLVVIGQPGDPNAPALPGLSSSFDHAFRVDVTAPTIVSASLAQGGATLPLGNSLTAINGLTALSLNVIDPQNPTGGPLATPSQVYFPALDPATASNISNYSLINLDDPTDPDKSRFIASARFTPTAPDFVSAPNRLTPADPYAGRIDLTFTTGLNRGRYELIAHTAETVGAITYGGLTDAAGNALDDTSVPGEGAGGNKNFVVSFNVQPEPVYITSVSTNVNNAQGNSLLPRSYYEINPRAGDIVSAPPTTYFVDFSNPLNAAVDYTDAVQLIRSADSSTGTADGDFGTLGVAGLGSTGTGFSRFNPAGTAVFLAPDAKGNPNSRLVLQLPAGTVLPADHYRLYIPNSGTPSVGGFPGTGPGPIQDIYNNQLDGEFLGNPAIAGVDANGNPAYEDLLPNGQFRQGMSGDGVPGGAFTTGFVVAPTGNIVYARPDYSEDSLLASTTPDGSIAKPYSVLAPQAVANALNSGTLNNGDPNGGLNSTVNFLSGFNPTYDRAGIGVFARSALYAAQQLSTLGPVVVVALPGTPQRDPITGVVSQKTFVLQAPAGSDSKKNDGSASVPFDTLLVFNSGSTLKLQNASLFIQNQGAALETIGGNNPNDRVTFTSYADDTVAGDTNRNGSDTVPLGGDWGGIVFRNFNQAVAGRTDVFPIDVKLAGPGGSSAVSGADDSLSALTFANIRYAGGAVPATRGTRYDAVTLYNSRPAITQDNISFTSGGQVNGNNRTSGSAQASISGDLDSFREDDNARGPLIRRVKVLQNGLNGIWIRPSFGGVVQQTDSIVYPDNPLSLGGVRNFALDAPLPYILLSRLEVGTQILNDTVDQTVTPVLNRLYVQPGALVKFQRGAGIEVITPGSSINIGDRTYINGFDSLATIDFTSNLPTSTYGPLTPGFRPSGTGDARVVFTSLYDNTATTSFFDPLTQLTTIIVPVIDSPNAGANNPLQPTPGNVPALARWGSLTVYSGAIGNLDEAEFRYGGGSLNVAGGTTTRQVLTLNGSQGGQRFQFVPGQGFVLVNSIGDGSHVLVTNNYFYDNQDAPIHADPDALLSTDPTRPLASGHPVFRGNILLRNDFNALAVGGTGAGGANNINLTNDSIWDQTDITYLLRTSIIPAGDFFGSSSFNLPPIGGVAPPLGPELKPTQTLTIQSALPDTVLATGQKIPRPGESIIIKTINTGGAVPGDGLNGSSNADYGGAGFLFGVDDGIDPPADPTIDQGNKSVLRILGIGGNETTGQQRVPVIITSIHDNTVGSTVRGIAQNQVVSGDVTAPKAGDGGLIYFGGNAGIGYNAFDVREGNKIDNADIHFLTRVEMQGGGVINYIDSNASNSFDIPDGVDFTKRGVFPNLLNGQPDPRNAFLQGNANKQLTISNSNLSNFSSAGIVEHPGFQLIAGGVRTSFNGQPNLLFLYNNTISNVPIGVRVVGQNGPNTNFPDVTELLLLNNTFYNDGVGVDLQEVSFDGTNSRAHVHLVAMDNIFSSSSTAAIRDIGQSQGSLLEYNLFFTNSANILDLAPVSGNEQLAGLNFQPIFGDPKFRDPANGNLQLLEGSAAIDSGRDELSLNPDAQGAIVGTLIPIATQVLDARGGIRNNNSREPDSNNFDLSNIPNNKLTLPGYPTRGYVDQFVPVLQTDPTGSAGPDSSAATFNYAPIDGERDSLGYLRQKDPNSSNVGFGLKPYFDLGAYEFRALFPPHVTNVTATVADPNNPTNPATTIPLYKVGGDAGTNQTIQTIQVQFDNRIDPNTINERTVLLEASGGDGIFGNNNSANDKFYNLAGKLSFDPNSHILTINIGAAGLNLQNDAYRLFLLGSGSDVLRDPQGNALDGENTLNDDPNNPQLPLPSGDGFPGGIFFDTFVVNTQPSALVSGSLHLDSSTDTNIVGDRITSNNLPSFTGTVTVAQPNIVPLGGQTVFLDVSTKGDGVFDRLNAGTALTTGTGQFLVTVGKDAANTGLVTNKTGLPDSSYNVGPDGLLGTRDDSGYTEVRVRIIDQSGNVSDLPSDPLALFIAKGAETTAVIDTAPPHVTSLTPLPGTPIAPDSSGKVTFTFVIDKNIDPNTVNKNSLIVTRAGADGILNTADDVIVPIDAGSINISALGGTPKGPAKVSFTISGGLPNDIYQFTIKGTGATPLTDIAGNALAGQFTGSFPSGSTNKTGSDFVGVYALYRASNVSLRFAGQASDITNLAAPKGSRSNPYLLINRAITQAAAGDVIAVLPGVYTENIVLKPFIKLMSADPTSTNTALVNGNPLLTTLRAPAASFLSTKQNVTISAANLLTIPGIVSEVSGFSIASPLLGDPALGPIDPNSTAVDISNSSLLLDRNYILDSHQGVHVVTSGFQAATPTIVNNVIAGNDNGIVLDDKGAASLTQPTQVINNDLVFNTVGLLALDFSNSVTIANIVNNIIWQNHDLTTARAGTGISSTFQGKLIVRNDLFSGNGPSDLNPADDTVGVGGGFNPSALTTTPNFQGNYVGNPSFVFPVDPRPNSTGPGTFYLEANFALTSRSAAIDAADSFTAPGQDILYHNRVRVAGHGFPNLGPADVGAFEFIPTTAGGGGGTLPGGPFRVATSSIAPNGAAVGNGAVVFSASNLPKSITVTFSQNVDTSSLQPSDVILFGNGLNPVGPARVTSVTALNGNRVQFNLSSGFTTQGTVGVQIAAGAVKDTTGAPVAAFSDFFRISPTAAGSNVIRASSVSNASTAVVAIAPAASNAVKTSLASPSLLKLAALAPPTPLVGAPAHLTPSAAHAPHGPLFKAKGFFRRLAKKN